MIARVFAGRLGGEGDLQAAPVRVGLLREDADPRLLRHQRRQRHAAEPRLVRLQRGRAAGEGRSGGGKDGEYGQAAAQSPRLRACKAPLLGAIAADLHFAPAAAVVLAAIIEQPAASMSAAFPDAMKIAFGEERHRRERDRAERRFDRRRRDAPTPAAGEDARRKLGLGDASRVKAPKEPRAPPRRASRHGRAPRRCRVSPRAGRAPARAGQRPDPRASKPRPRASRPLPPAAPWRARAIARRAAASRRWSSCEGKPRPDSVLAKSSARSSAISGSEPAREGGRSGVITVIIDLYRLSHAS